MEDGSDAADAVINTKEFESIWSLDILNCFQMQFTTFSARKVFFDIDELNSFMAKTHMGRSFYDCELVTLDGKYVVKSEENPSSSFFKVPFGFKLV